MCQENVSVKKCCSLCEHLHTPNCPLNRVIQTAENCAEYSYSEAAKYEVLCYNFELNNNLSV